MKMNSSDYIKTALVAVLGGTESEWKRVSKSGNLRTFTHKTLGTFPVLELAQGYQVIKSNGEITSLTVPSPTPAYTPEQIEAALEVINKIRKEGYWEYDHGSEALLERAGNALAQHYVFGVVDGEDGIFAAICPKYYWEENGFCFDQQSPLERILPEGDDVNGCGTYCFEDLSLKEIKAMLISKGFVYDKEFEAFMQEGAHL
jgi:hypothetical protein